MTRNLDEILIPERFASQGTTEAVWVADRRRADLDEEEAASILAEIARVEWADLPHAYGNADDVAAQLAALQSTSWRRRTAPVVVRRA